MSFSNHLRKLAASIWDAQLSHPFVVALGKGTLPEPGRIRLRTLRKNSANCTTGRVAATTITIITNFGSVKFRPST